MATPISGARPVFHMSGSTEPHFTFGSPKAESGTLDVFLSQWTQNRVLAELEVALSASMGGAAARIENWKPVAAPGRGGAPARAGKVLSTKEDECCQHKQLLRGHQILKALCALRSAPGRLRCFLNQLGRLLSSSAFLWCSFVTLLAQYCYFDSGRCSQ